MNSQTTSETHVWFPLDDKLVRVSECVSSTIGINSKTTFSITVIEQPMTEALETAKRNLVDPYRSQRIERARQIFQSMQSLQNQLTDVIAESQM